MINLVRIHEKMYLLIELVGIVGNKQIGVFKNIKEKSSLVWNFAFLIVPSSQKKSNSLESIYYMAKSKQQYAYYNFKDYI